MKLEIPVYHGLAFPSDFTTVIAPSVDNYMWGKVLCAVLTALFGYSIKGNVI